MSNKELSDYENKFYGKQYQYILTEKDFYPPSDNRTWQSNVRDIIGGDNFAEFCEEFFELLDEEDYFEDDNY